jgi:hypothetical protein
MADEVQRLLLLLLDPAVDLVAVDEEYEQFVVRVRFLFGRIAPHVDLLQSFETDFCIVVLEYLFEQELFF